MGLDITYDAFNGAYSSFMRFRKELAKKVGIDLRFMQGFADKEFENVAISWDKIKYDPIHILLNHSDCDGEITLKKCKELLPRLEEIRESITDISDEEIGSKLTDFINGTREAINNNDSLEFM